MRGALRVYYRTVEVTGREHLDASRPTILAATHGNSIVDPLLLGLFEDRQVTFCARDGLFKVPLFGRLLRAVGAVPIARPSDHGKGNVDNAGAFAAARKVLEDRGVIAIFPEGHTHERLKVHRLKTGAARIALDAAIAGDTNVQIVPVALNYLVRQAFRSDVHVAFGHPIDARAFAAAAADDPRAAARSLTDHLEEALRELAVHVDETEDERVIAQVTSLIVDIRHEEGLDGGGQTPAERTALVRRVVDAYRWLTERDPEKTAGLRRRLQRYLEERTDLGLGGESAALQHRSEASKGAASKRFRSRRRFIVLGAPAALYGAVHNAPPYLLLRGFLRVTKPRKDRQALTKLLVGLSLFGGSWVAYALAVAMVFGPVAGLAYGLTLPFAAVFALRYATEVRLHRLNWRGLRSLWVHSERIAALRDERDALKGEIAALREEYLAEMAAQGGSAAAG
ncbi:MAG: 1-acyl-sn-glycerol-3-phosphate acyltransferase [Myxococcales bacterium]|nr:1-acyl-sn-glycerol-3-phosphate acyltransferase [Myxococcales bacterium]